MTPAEQAQKLQDLIDFIGTDLPVFAENVLANDLAALVSNRVIQRGENYKGALFTPYSLKKISAFRLVAKSRNNSADVKVRALAKAKSAISYSEFRALNNLNTNKKNFNFTGTMWRKFGVIKVSTNGYAFKIQIGGQTASAQDKIDKNSEREKISIIEANDDEHRLAERATQNWITEQANRILNG